MCSSSSKWVLPRLRRVAALELGIYGISVNLLLLSAGVHPAVVAAQHGDSVETTMVVYSHVLQGLQEDAAVRIERYFPRQLMPGDHTTVIDMEKPFELAIKLRTDDNEAPCAICGEPIASPAGSGLFLADSWAVVCQERGRKYAPELANLIQED